LQRGADVALPLTPRASQVRLLRPPRTVGSRGGQPVTLSYLGVTLNGKGHTSMTMIAKEPQAPGETLTVAERLRVAIDESGMTQLELATRLAEELGKPNPSSVRRLVNKWLAGTQPGRRYALKLALIFDT